MTCWRSKMASGLVLIGLASSLEGQAREIDPARAEELEPRVQLVLEGLVVDQGGAPAEAALVVSSAGGKALTDRNGTYRLEVGVPVEARRVQVTAVGGSGSPAASTSVELPAGAARVRVVPLALARGSACPPSWLPTFRGQPGVDDDVLALAVFDDGGGPALYAGGIFEVAGGVVADRIAKWDGATWSALDSGFSGGLLDVSALAVFDDGSGPALYAGGSFTTAGGVTVNNVARWDGSSWSALGSGVGDPVRALAVFDDGGGPALYAGGEFTTAGGVAANRIAKWDGASWSPLGSGLSGSTLPAVLALAVFDDGSGPALHAGGSFTSAGGMAASRIARWNGASWSPLGSGVSSLVRALAVFDDGGGPALHAGGDFTTAGGAPASKIARWDGSSWAALGSGLKGQVHALTVFDDGGGPALHAGGFMSSAGGHEVRNIARWDGASWSALGGGLDEVAFALTVFDDGSGAALHAGGRFTKAGGAAANRIAGWNGTSWDAPGNGLDLDVQALAVFDDGGGSALYAGGTFTTAGGMPASRIARWDGSTWAPLGSGMSGFNAFVAALAVFDDGSGPALFAGGLFTSAGGVAASRIAKWDGSGWTALGSGVGGSAFAGVYTLTVFDDGGGPALYAGGAFTTAGGVTANNIARWDGATWSTLGSGVNGSVSALAVFDDGGGSALYAGGSFGIAGGNGAFSIAKWDGATWSTLGSGAVTGVIGRVYALTVFDDGGGPALYAGGDFTTAGSVTANRIAKWDGASWSALAGGGVGSFFVVDLAVFDDGSGSALYAGGDFTTAGSVAANRIAKWDGSGWSALGSGMNNAVFALTAFDDGSGDALFAGGEFTSALDSGDSFLARWGCPDTTPPTIACPSRIVVDDRPPGAGEIVTFIVTAFDEEDPAPSVVCVPPSGSLFPRGTTLVTCTATDSSGNQATCQFTVKVRAKVRTP